MTETHRSYTSSSAQTASTAFEFLYLYKGLRRAAVNMKAEVDELIQQVRDAEVIIERLYGKEIRNCKVLEVGVGQLPRQIAYFALNNDVIGIDLDVIPSHLRLDQYYQLFRTNGTKRLLKTIGRKILGMDRRFLRELRRALGVTTLPMPKLCSMNATAMTFPDQSFDFVYSFNVFEHLPAPAAVLREIRRVLKPGGCVVSHLHLYTSDSGCHDVRILSGQRECVPYWPHLRPHLASTVKNAAFINKLRISEWEMVFNTEMPESVFVHYHDPDASLKMTMITELRSDGELKGYSDEELLTRNFASFWQKPM